MEDPTRYKRETLRPLFAELLVGDFFLMRRCARKLDTTVILSAENVAGLEFAAQTGKSQAEPGG